MAIINWHVPYYKEFLIMVSCRELRIGYHGDEASYSVQCATFVMLTTWAHPLTLRHSAIPSISQTEWRRSWPAKVSSHKHKTGWTRKEETGQPGYVKHTENLCASVSQNTTESPCRDFQRRVSYELQQSAKCGEMAIKMNLRCLVMMDKIPDEGAALICLVHQHPLIRSPNNS